MNKENLPFVSVIIPCRNEERHIDECLSSVLLNDYPKELYEILVVDGLSSDGTRKIVADYCDKYSFIKIVDNPQKYTPFAFNAGIKNAKGDYIFIMGAHSVYDKRYISQCVNAHLSNNVDNVGGIWKIVPQKNNLLSNAIAFAMSSVFGAGNARYKASIPDKPMEVDTVFGGCYKNEVFKKIGLFDEELVRNQDDEFNMRLIKAGGKILLVPDIICYYYARDSYTKLWKMYYQYGYFKPLVVKKVGSVMTIRQLVPFLFVCSFVILPLLSILVWKKFIYLWYLDLFMYFTANLYFSLKCAIKNNIKLLPFIMWAFVVMHFGYGYGYIRGITDFMLLGKKKVNNKKEILLNR